MLRLILAFVAAGVLSPSAWASTRYTVSDKGLFAPTGRSVEFSDRFGWVSYEAKFKFGIDVNARSLSPDSTLDLTVRRTDGTSWSYRCKARDPREMRANINSIYGRGTLVVVECRVRADKFASAVGLDGDMVGSPTLVFSAWLRDGKVETGSQKGFYFLNSAQIGSSVMAQYATENDDPSELAVIFSTEQDIPAGEGMSASRYYYQPTARFVP
ncbi:MAG: hypothetical protein NTX64_17845 [Elusimicrobia bacterium]|nr:hypothetical protein [Elusimicrobiota bacterium]